MLPRPIVHRKTFSGSKQGETRSGPRSYGLDEHPYFRGKNVMKISFSSPSWIYLQQWCFNDCIIDKITGKVQRINIHNLGEIE